MFPSQPFFEDFLDFLLASSAFDGSVEDEADQVQRPLGLVTSLGLEVDLRGVDVGAQRLAAQDGFEDAAAFVDAAVREVELGDLDQKLDVVPLLQILERSLDETLAPEFVLAARCDSEDCLEVASHLDAVDVELVLDFDVVLAQLAQLVDVLGLDRVRLEYAAVVVLADALDLSVRQAEVLVLDGAFVELAHGAAEDGVVALEVAVGRLDLHPHFVDVELDLLVDGHVERVVEGLAHGVHVAAAELEGVLEELGPAVEVVGFVVDLLLDFVV